VATLWAYQDRVCEAVVAAKYAHQSPLGDALGRRLGCRIEPVFAGDSPDFVTYVPSHITRQFSRGGNGIQVIARAVAKAIGRPCHLPLKTTRRIAKQAWLDDVQRIENVRGAFSLKKSYAFSRSPRIADRHILVVDDVLTTGATANEVARVFRSGGARRVSLAVVARAVRSQ
jgi:predicted amidophosphoribosyltransferase